MMRLLVVCALVALSVAAPRYRRQATMTLEEQFCDMKLEGAVHGFFADPSNCARFWSCMKVMDKVYATHMSCGIGTYWSQTSLTCTQGTAQCLSDPCQDPTVAALGLLPDPDNCAGYLQCDHGRSVRKCCQTGLQWNDNLQACDYKTDCTQACSITAPPTVSTTTVAHGADECVVGNFIYAEGSNEGSFKQISLDRTTEDVLMCPVSMPTFSLAECACVGDQTVTGSQCVLFDYEQDFSTGGMWVQHEGVTLKDGQALFQDGHISIPYFNNMDFRQALTVSVDMSDDGTQGEASLVSNDGSISLALRSGEVVASLMASGQTDACSVAIPVGQKESLKMTYDGSELVLSSVTEKKTVACTGDVKRMATPLVLGKNFAGSLDNVKVCKNVE